MTSLIGSLLLSLKQAIWTLFRPLCWLALGLRGLLRSFRFWLLALLAVLVLLILYHALADLYTPITTDAYIQAYVVQIAPQIGGQVIRVYAHEGDQVKAGALLFEIDPRPIEHRIAYLQAKLIETRQKVKQLSSAKEAAQAEHRRLQAEAAYANTVFQQEQAIYKKSATTERKFLEARDRHRAAQAAVEKAAIQIQHAEESLAARVGREHASIAQVLAELAEAKLNLSFTKVVAPCAGVITDLQLREGTYLHTGQSAMTLIDTSSWHIIAHFRENALRRMLEGQPALVALQANPGQLFPARVRYTGWGVLHGQGIPSGKLPHIERPTSWVQPSQRFQVRLVLDLEPDHVIALRVGMTGSVSVYIEEQGWLPDLTRALHQLLAWLYYL